METICSLKWQHVLISHIQKMQADQSDPVIKHGHLLFA